jgi:hypothetical protein
VSPFRRRNEPLADDALIVVRGGLLVAASLRRDARIAYLRFGEYGISALAAPDATSLDRIAGGPLRGYPKLTLMTAGAVRGAGLELHPTFRRPHYTIVFVDLDDGVRRLLSCDNDVIDNRHHHEDPGEEERP